MTAANNDNQPINLTQINTSSPTINQNKTAESTSINSTIKELSFNITSLDSPTTHSQLNHQAKRISSDELDKEFEDIENLVTETSSQLDDDIKKLDDDIKKSKESITRSAKAANQVWKEQIGEEVEKLVDSIGNQDKKLNPEKNTTKAKSVVEENVNKSDEVDKPLEESETSIIDSTKDGNTTSTQDNVTLLTKIKNFFSTMTPPKKISIQSLRNHTFSLNFNLKNLQDKFSFVSNFFSTKKSDVSTDSLIQKYHLIQERKGGLEAIYIKENTMRNQLLESFIPQYQQGLKNGYIKSGTELDQLFQSLTQKLQEDLQANLNEKNSGSNELLESFIQQCQKDRKSGSDKEVNLRRQLNKILITASDVQDQTSNPPIKSLKVDDLIEQFKNNRDNNTGLLQSLIQENEQLLDCCVQQWGHNSLLQSFLFAYPPFKSLIQENNNTKWVQSVILKRENGQKLNKEEEELLRTKLLQGLLDQCTDDSEKTILRNELVQSLAHQHKGNAKTCFIDQSGQKDESNPIKVASNFLVDLTRAQFYLNDMLERGPLRPKDSSTTLKTLNNKLGEIPSNKNESVLERVSHITHQGTLADFLAELQSLGSPSGIPHSDNLHSDYKTVNHLEDLQQAYDDLTLSYYINKNKDNSIDIKIIAPTIFRDNSQDIVSFCRITLEIHIPVEELGKKNEAIDLPIKATASEMITFAKSKKKKSLNKQDLKQIYTLLHPQKM